MKVKSLSRSQLLATPWTAAYQAALSMDFPGKSTGVGCHAFSEARHSKAIFRIWLDSSQKNVYFMCIREKCFLKSFSSFGGEEKSRYQKKKSLKIIRETILAGTMNLRTTTTGGGQNE